MVNWLNNSGHLENGLVPAFDARVDRRLRQMDIVLALLALLVLALPMLAALSIGRLRSTEHPGCGNQVFMRRQIRFPDTFLGRMLKKSGAGNWPILFNILRGEVAWVGHSLMPATVDYAYHPALNLVRPGLISIWAMRQRTAVDFGSKAEADLEYLSRRCVRHDFSLLFRAALMVWIPMRRPVSDARIQVGDVSFDNVSMEQAVQRISQMLDGKQPHQVSFVNPACVNIASRDRGYRRLLARTALVLPDGIGIKIAAHILGVSLNQNVNGTDLFPRLCEMLEQRGASIYLLGGQPGVAVRVAEEIGVRWPLVRIVGIRDGFFSVTGEGEVAAHVRSSGADVVLVARGVPMQDVFIDRHLHQLGVKVAIGVGGLFDFVSGRIRRAPTWMRDCGLEWIFRLLQEPSRMWRRYLLGNFTFLGRIVLQRFGLRRAANDAAGDHSLGKHTAPEDSTALRCILFATATAPPDVPVAADFPAALLPLGWSTFIECAIAQIAGLGIRHIDLVVSSRPEELRRILGMGERWGVHLRWHLAKDAATPYALLRSMGLAPQQRVLLGHAHRLLADQVLSSLIAQDQMITMDSGRPDAVWAGWGSVIASIVCAQSAHNDESAMGALLCDLTPHLQLLQATDFVNVRNAVDLLSAQHGMMTDESLQNVPASWLQTAWGAHSPDAVIQDGAQISRPTLIGPGCFVAAGAILGSNTVLTRDVVVSNSAVVKDSLLFPHTFIGQGLELAQTLVKGRSVQHLVLEVRTVLPASDGLLLDLKHQDRHPTSWFSRAVAATACAAVLPWLAVDTGIRRARGLPLRWHARLSVVGRDSESGKLRLQPLRCARSSRRGAGHVLAHYGALMDVMAGHRSWFGSRPRSQSEWYALSHDWQLLLAKATIGCLHAPAWIDDEGGGQEARAAADVFFAVSRNLSSQIRIVVSLIEKNLRFNSEASSIPVVIQAFEDVTIREREKIVPRASQILAQNILDSVENKIAVLNHLGDIVATNFAWKKFWVDNIAASGGLISNVDVGTNYISSCKEAYELIEEPACMRQNIEAVIEGRLQHFRFEYPLRLQNVQRWFSVTVTPLNTGSRGAVVVHNDITVLKQVEEEMRNYAYYDSLTSLANRRFLQVQLDKAIKKCKRNGLLGAMLLLDLDNFKNLNDSAGHAAGDFLLKEVSRRLTACVSTTSTVARLGGDEFVVLIDELNQDNKIAEEQAMIIAEKIRLHLAEPYFLCVENDPTSLKIKHQCSSSIGITLFSGHETDQMEVFKQADLAMYEAKKMGRNYATLFNSNTVVQCT